MWVRKYPYYKKALSYTPWIAAGGLLFDGGIESIKNTLLCALVLLFVHILRISRLILMLPDARVRAICWLHSGANMAGVLVPFKLGEIFRVCLLLKLYQKKGFGAWITERFLDGFWILLFLIIVSGNPQNIIGVALIVFLLGFWIFGMSFLLSIIAKKLLTQYPSPKMANLTVKIVSIMKLSKMSRFDFKIWGFLIIITSIIWLLEILAIIFLAGMIPTNLAAFPLISMGGVSINEWLPSLRYEYVLENIGSIAKFGASYVTAQLISSFILFYIGRKQWTL